MATHAQMSRTAANPAAVQSMATHLLGLGDAGWTDWEIDFLENMRAFRGPDPISTRQREVLFDLDDKARTFGDWEGLSVRHLVAQVHHARLDLDEEDEAFVADLYARRAERLRRRPLARLVRCARLLGVIDRD